MQQSGRNWKPRQPTDDEMTKPFAIVTGASEGIGRTFAEELGAKGRNLILVARSADRLEALGAELRARHAVEVIVIAMDLGQEGAATVLRDKIGDRSIDCLINNAGFQVPMGAVMQNDAQEVRAMIALNIVALSELAQAFLPDLIKTRGTLVNVASHAAFQPVPYMAAYAASKSYVLHYTEALKAEIADSHPGTVHIMALCPGATRTKFWERAASPVENTLFPVMTPEAVVACAMKAMKRRSQTVVIPSFVLALSTQALRLGPRALNAIIAKRLVGH